MTTLQTFAPLAVIFGLLSALSWGTGDFCGGVATQRSPGYSVVMVAEFVGAVLLIGLALITREPWPNSQSLLIALIAGLAGVVGLGALYQGLAIGKMGVVAPLSAIVGGAVPIIVALFIEGWPSVTQIAGFGLALVAVWLLAGTGEFKANRREIMLALIAGLGFGFYFVLIAQASTEYVFWPLSIARTAAGIAFLLFILITRHPVLPSRDALGLSSLAGIADAGGNLFFAFAAQSGRLDVAAVVASLYPGMTVILARFVLHERLTKLQTIGIVTALIAVVLIAL